MARDYVAATVPAKKVYVSSTTYFHMAAHDFNDAMRWIDFAHLNMALDPWVPGGPVQVLIPPVLTVDETGITNPIVIRDYNFLAPG